ncbi:ABC1 kinase family protein [Methyloceanibacter marginalis]|uniref:ABC1 kinase family protein n=1 Tax=Methyloceanibacter marginalis TaxID=1774971 RepID=UPI000ABF475F|nr:AarF/ABC1/UbiB kinase family protein [Methyloceanibacter marginalis]
MNDTPEGDNEKNRFSARAKRYGRVGANVGGVAARIAGRRLFGLDPEKDKDAAALAAALGGLKGPIMKVAQLLATIPEALPAEYAAELGQLQSQAPPMGWAFVRRRMAAELGPDWEARFATFEHAAAAASLGQVHRAVAHDGRALAVKLQYPDMQSAVEADLAQLGMLFSLHRRMRPAIETSEMLKEISARLREELDYALEAKHTGLYGLIFADDPMIRVPDVLPELSTKRLLTMTWLDGRRLLDYTDRPLEERNQIARAMFRAWWFPFSQYGVIHATRISATTRCSRTRTARRPGINLLDYGCMRTFAPKFIQGVIDLYHGLLNNDRALVVHAYETWGFTGLSNELIDILNIWAKFIYGPMLEDRVRTIAEYVKPGAYGRQEAFKVHQGLREKGPVTVPREFVFMDRAAIGLGGVFLHLNAELNYYRLFNEAIAGADLADVTRRQHEAFVKTGVPLPEEAGKQGL